MVGGAGEIEAGSEISREEASVRISSSTFFGFSDPENCREFRRSSESLVRGSLGFFWFYLRERKIERERLNFHDKKGERCQRSNSLIERLGLFLILSVCNV